MLEDAPDPPGRPEPKKLLVIGVGSLLVTGLTFGLAMCLGSWGYEEREWRFHVTRVQNMTDEKPTLAQVLQGLAADGTLLVASPDDAEALAGALAGFSTSVREEARRRAAGWPTIKVFQSGGVAYVLLFDDGDILRDFICLKGRIEGAGG